MIPGKPDKYCFPCITSPYNIQIYLISEGRSKPVKTVCTNGFQSILTMFQGKHCYVPNPGAAGRAVVVEMHQARRQLLAPDLSSAAGQMAGMQLLAPLRCKYSGLRLPVESAYYILTVLSLIQPKLHLHILLIICTLLTSWANQDQGILCLCISFLQRTPLDNQGIYQTSGDYG